MISAPSSVMPTIAAQLFPWGFLVDRSEDLFQACYVAFSLPTVFFEGSFQCLAVRRLRHLGEGAQNLLFRKIDIFESVVE
jgi:hypothetical protein